MYYCSDCGYEFNKSCRISETHSLNTPPYEDIYVCPRCKGRNYYERPVTHCRCCGARILNNEIDYCSEKCRIKGELLWRKELTRRKLNIESPVYRITRELENYNAINRTNYSYGQYVTLVRPALKKRGKTDRG